MSTNLKSVVFYFSTLIAVINALNYTESVEESAEDLENFTFGPNYETPNFTTVFNENAENETLIRLKNHLIGLNLFQLALKLNLTIFADSLIKSGLHKIVDHEGPFTIFAPTNEAFISAPKYCQNVPLEDRMKYHITRGRTLKNELENNLMLWTILSKRYVRVNIYEETNKITASGREVIRPDNFAVNGIIHVLKDEMCAIYKGGAMFEINRCPAFKNATLAVNATGLFYHLDNINDLTIFVPTDEAIQALPVDTLKQLVADKGFLKKVVLNHVVPKTLYKAGMYEGQVLKAASGKKINLSVKNGSVVINGSSKVILADATVANGVVHSIDQVIIDQGN